MLSKLFQRSKVIGSDLLSSNLYDEVTFYPAFLKDLGDCKSEVIIECSFVTNRRLSLLLPVLQKLKDRKVRVIINTRDPHEHDDDRRRDDAHVAIASLQRLAIQVLYTGWHHRKLVILDRKVLYEGSLNILSQNDSCEIMRRIESVQMAWEMIGFVGLDKYF